MKVRYKAAIKEKEFAFKEGDNIKIVVTSFLYATETRPERNWLRIKMKEIIEKLDKYQIATKMNKIVLRGV
ncbi:hypothetical protein GMA19_00861 [Paenibacillus polymyxa E681]|uniref:hypothetical protein n=1 Tax=Paenibacillus polymyxa TaxID=1406 RepID=UPI0005C6DE48|nr:hypothetical protein [Paenibacillus polymyxa]AJW69139.1 hypothetical protein PPE_05280 [Paenibacillus polymyxa E681]QNV55709.1 hypothetical protein GE561_00862 [Paenibacillus polymyxa E681]QNV60545.1 hypothetical protein GMA19_00861 [Paenibacillus polymyxa E681]URJ46969.1 hypothetical protein MF628_001554 [Paenibacillus polymyxa]